MIAFRSFAVINRIFSEKRRGFRLKMRSFHLSSMPLAEKSSVRTIPGYCLKWTEFECPENALFCLLPLFLSNRCLIRADIGSSNCARDNPLYGLWTHFDLLCSVSLSSWSAQITKNRMLHMPFIWSRLEGNVTGDWNIHFCALVSVHRFFFVYFISFSL